MTDSENVKVVEKQETLQQDKLNQKPVDIVLEIFLSGLENADETNPNEITGLGITFNIGGLLISGELISQKQYFDEFLDGKLRDKIKEIVENDEQLNKFAGSSETDPTVFIHLKNAHFFSPGQKPLPTSPEGTLWRGRICDVEGYFLGVLVAN